MAVSLDTLTPAQLAERRKALGLTQAMLAGLVRTHRVTITLYETGHYHIPERRVKQLASALDGVALGQQIARQAGEAGRP